MTSTRLVLIRHGQSRATIERRLSSARTCTGLTDFGRRQAEALRHRLSGGHDVHATALYSSSYSRALETAQIIAPALGSLPLSVEPGWGEHDPGPDCDGLLFQDFVALHGQPDWDSDPHDVIFPGGETIHDFHTRIVETLRRTVRAHEGETIVVSCHGGVIDAVLRHTLHMKQVGGFELQTSNTSITELLHLHSSRWRLIRYNDASHLAGLAPEE